MDRGCRTVARHHHTSDTRVARRAARASDAVHTQLAVAFVHGVPYMSPIDGLGPLSTPAVEAWFNSTWFSEPLSDFHPGPWAHELLAASLIHYLNTQRLFRQHFPHRGDDDDDNDRDGDGASDGRQPGRAHPAPYCPRRPAFIEQAVLDMYLDSSPLHIPTVNPYTANRRMKNCTGWAIAADVPGKPGLLTQTQGSRCTVVASDAEVRRHPVQSGEAHVTLLKSYKHMGVVRVTVMLVPAVPRNDGSGRRECDIGGGDGSAKVLGSKDIDCLWGQHVSESQVETFPIQRSEEADVCLAFTFELLDSGRAENKAKIIGITVF